MTISDDVTRFLRQPGNGSLLLLALACWLIVHPYSGIVHDSILYAASAMRRAHPDVLASDFFFGQGTQFEFTVFPSVHALAMTWWGLGAGSMYLLVLGHVAWLLSAFLLVQRLSPPRAAALAMVFVAALPSNYGGLGMLQYGESFLTPRVFAEACVLLALYGALSRRTLLTVSALVLGCALHPLMGLAGVAVLAVYVTLADRRWLWLWFVIAALALVLAQFDVAPFDRLLQRMEPDWRATVAYRSPLLFPSQWQPWDWASIALAIGLTGLACQVSSLPNRRLYAATCIVGVLGILVTWIGSDVLSNVLTIQLQPWRVGWLTQFVGMVALAGAFEKARDVAPQDRGLTFTALAVAAAVLAFAHFVPLNVAVALVVAIPALALLAWPAAMPYLAGRRWRGLSYGAVVGLGLFGLFAAVGYAYHWWLNFGRKSEPTSGLPDIFLYWLAIFLGVVVVGMAQSRPAGPRWRHVVAAGLAIILLPLGLLTWDRRTDWDVLIESADAGDLGLSANFPPNASVYWESDLKATWFLLRRASYFSRYQGAGVAFDRARAVEFDRRRSIIEVLGTDDAYSGFDIENLLALRRVRVQAKDILAVCQAKDGPDVLVLTRHVNGIASSLWHSPVAKMIVRHGPDHPLPELVRDYAIYNCRALAQSG